MVFFFKGLMAENDDHAVFLGKFTYDKDGKPLQYFPIQVKEGEKVV